MGSHFSVLRPQPTTSILPTSISHHHSRTNSHHNHVDSNPNPASPTHTTHTTSHDFFFSPALSALLGPTLPPDSAYWSTSLLDLCQSLSALSTVTSAEVEAVLTRSCRAMHTATVVQRQRNLQQLMVVVSWHMERLVQRLAGGSGGVLVSPSSAAAAAAVADTAAADLSLDAVLNLLFLCRTFIGYIIEHSTAEQLLACFDYTPPPFPPPSSPSTSTPPQPQPLPVSAVFVSSLFSVVCYLPVTAVTYDFHLESLHTLLTLLSTQLYQPTAPLQPSYHSFLSAALYTLPSLPPPPPSQPPQPLPPTPAQLMAALLNRYTEEVCAHYERPAGSEAATAEGGGGGRRSLLVQLRSGLSSILLLPYTIYHYFFPPPPLPYPLADRALLTLLLLTHQQHTPTLPNPYRTALAGLADSEGEGGGAVSFDGVYSALLYVLPGRRGGVLLLFSMLHLCPSWLEYCYAKTEIELLILPLLQSLYNHIRSLDTPNKSASSSSTQSTTTTTTTTAQPAALLPQQQQQAEPKDVYMLLIILLLLSSDTSFVAQSHRLTLTRIPWHTDYPLTHISLASFTSLLLLRLLSLQLSGPAVRRDGYVVSNVLAILANVARGGRAVHAAVARRMVSVLEVVVKRWKRVKKRERMTAIVAGGGGGGGVEEEAREVLAVLSQYLTVLCVYAHPSHLHENIPLLYALMHDKRHLALLADETRHAIDQRVTYLLGLIAHFELVVDIYHQQQRNHHKPTLPSLPLLTITKQPSSVLPLPAGVVSAASTAAAAAAGGSAELDPLLAALAADASHWRLTVAGSSLGAYVVEGESFAYAEEESSYEFVIPYVWEVGREEGGWKDGWGGGGVGVGGSVDDEGGGGLDDDVSEDAGLLAGEEVRVNGSTKVVGVHAV